MWLFRLRRMFRVAGRDALILFFAIRDPRTPKSLKLAAAAALAWIISPVDPLPDLPLIGWVDDMLVLSVALPALIRRLPAAVRGDADASADRFIAAWWPGRRRDDGASVDGKPAEVLDATEAKPTRRRAPAKAGATAAAASAAGAARRAGPTASPSASKAARPAARKPRARRGPAAA